MFSFFIKDEEADKVIDRSTIRIVVIFLGAIALTATAGGLALAFLGQSIPDPVIAIGSGAAGALATIIAAATAIRAEAAREIRADNRNGVNTSRVEEP
jgi:ATP-dependent protease HslVU (ClpYQ) peptidase subunit